jgi:hypothetical protein
MTFSHFSQYDQYFLGLIRGRRLTRRRLRLCGVSGVFQIDRFFRLGIWNGCRWGRRTLG